MSRPTVALLAASSSSSACGGSSNFVVPLSAADQWTCKDWQDQRVLGQGYVYSQPAAGSKGEQAVDTLAIDLHEHHHGPFVNSGGYQLSANAENSAIIGMISQLCRKNQNDNYVPRPKAVILTLRALQRAEPQANSQSSAVVSPSAPSVTGNSAATGNRVPVGPLRDGRALP